ncbi:thiopeptide-type bacteriocin biosynthesis domain-containing protein [Chitinophaga sp. CF118]|uniref:lantibiotic dehydratase n=1 Tax=Chitinophaga sp. CF118 TaxID=1884367 RepID=UPI0008E34B3C|nr:lantibiotic dehydratase [Chitinophaga sp. CF118]SFE76616.1 thiopeptide-type bacteriocin biosynthesis domain-containing protein [Chitinophaga sp. CF118]
MIAAKDFYLLRTPLLPVNFKDQFTQITYKELADKISHIFRDPYLTEAIYIASPELYQELVKWQQGLFTGEKEIQKLVLALFRYILRMCTRCTPYGLFAGSATGQFDNTTSIELAHQDLHKKHCRLDMNYVAELVATISQIPEIQSQLTFYPNNSLYKIADAFRYAAFTINNKFRHYTLTSVNYSDYLQQILTTAAGGASIHTLCASIVSEEISNEEALEFIHELIESQILISSLEPTVTGEEFFSLFIKKLEALENTTPVTDHLSRIQTLLRQPNTSIDKYLQTHMLVKSLLPDTNSKDLVQTDLFLSTIHNTISGHLINDIQQQIIPLWKLSKLNNNPDLQQFCQRFRDRYEEQEIPLAIALDTESGIGYSGHTGSSADHTPLIDNIYIKNTDDAKTISWNKMQQFQFQRLQQCLRNHETEIVLTDDDLNELKETDIPSLPDSMYLMGSILGSSAAAVDTGNYLFEFSSCGGPSAANLLGRFCHGDAVLSEKVKDCLQEEERNNPDCIYAEIIHLPEARTGNILARPQLRDYEIVYLGNGSVAADHQIPITDLMVSVKNNIVILRSKKLNKRVIPRLSTAHNFSMGSLLVYKFLCDLQFQQLHHAAGWQWSLPGEERFLPAVRYKKIILSKCTWILYKKDYPALKDNGTTLLKEVGKQLQLPRYITITEGDNELFIDMESDSCLQLLATTLLKKERIIIQEMLSTPDNCWVTSTNGSFTHELIIPLKSTLLKKEQTASPVYKNMPVRSFITGSEWLYIKIYCGTNTAEKTLKSIIKPLIRELEAAHIIDKWFFIRYTDPDHHIRLRFHNSVNPLFWKVILEKLHTALQEHNERELIYKIQTDTYIREIERYGELTMELSETIFHLDSEAVLDCIDLLEGEEGETFRWLLAARGIDILLQDFGYTLLQKTTLLKRIQKHFFEEFGGDKALQTQLNDKYRQHMRQLSSFLDQQQDTANEIEEATVLFYTRSEKIRAIIKDSESLHQLIPSYIHMFLNRMLISNQRKHELVIYHFLSKYYDSQLAIAKKQAT